MGRGEGRVRERMDRIADLAARCAAAVLGKWAIFVFVYKNRPLYTHSKSIRYQYPACAPFHWLMNAAMVTDMSFSVAFFPKNLTKFPSGSMRYVMIEWSMR